MTRQVELNLLERGNRRMKNENVKEKMKKDSGDEEGPRV